jgi:hypothetical protein
MKIVFTKTELNRTTGMIVRLITAVNEKVGIKIPIPAEQDSLDTWLKIMTDPANQHPTLIVTESGDEFTISYNEEMMADFEEMFETVAMKTIDVAANHKFAIVIAIGGFKAIVKSVMPAIKDIFQPIMKPLEDLIDDLKEPVDKFSSKWFAIKSIFNNRKNEQDTDEDEQALKVEPATTFH